MDVFRACLFFDPVNMFSTYSLFFTLFVKQATKQFLEEVNKWTAQYSVSPLSWNVAVKFLMARKFDVLRAVELFHTYRVSSCRPARPAAAVLPRVPVFFATLYTR